MNLQPDRAASVATRAEQGSFDRTEERVLSVSSDQPVCLDVGVMRAMFAPGPKPVPFAKITQRDIQAGMNAAVDDGLQRNFHFARGDDLFHHVTAVVVDQHHPRASPDCGLPSRLADHAVG